MGQTRLLLEVTREAGRSLNATIAHAMGLPLDTTLLAANGRPFRVAAHGEPVAELF